MGAGVGAVVTTNERIKWAGGLTCAPGPAAAPGSVLKGAPTGLLAAGLGRSEKASRTRRVWPEWPEPQSQALRGPRLGAGLVQMSFARAAA